MAAYKEDTNSALILTIGAMSGFLVIVAVIGLQAWFMSEEQQEIIKKNAGSLNYQLQELRSEHRGKINNYRWIDRDKQIAAVPIDKAMDILIENHGKLPTTQPR